MKLSNDGRGGQEAAPWITTSAQELSPWLDGDQTPLLRQKREPPPEPPSPVKFGGCMFAEVILFMTIYMLMVELYESIGLEVRSYFIDDVLIGFLFSEIPDLTARHLLALLCSCFFVCVPIALWLDLLKHEHPFAGNGTQLIARGFLVIAFGFIAVGEYVMISHRVSLSSNNAFGTHSGHEPGLAMFFGLLFVVVNASVAFATASLYHQRNLARRG